MCCAGPGFWDEPTTSPADALYWDVHWLQYIPEENMLDSRYPGGLTVERVAPGRSFRFSYEREDCAFDPMFSAVSDPHEIVPNQKLPDLSPLAVDRIGRGPRTSSKHAGGDDAYRRARRWRRPCRVSE